MRVLYQRTDKPIPEDFVPSEVQKDIIDNYKPHYSLFSITVIAERNNKSRGHVQRKVKILRKMGLVERWPRHESTNGVS